MSTEAAMTPAPAGNDSVRPSISLDDASEIDFYDPSDEIKDTKEGEAATRSEIEPGEIKDDQEPEEIETSEDDDDVEAAEEPGEEDETSTPEPDDAAAITVDGVKLTVGELKKSYFREADYTRQKQRVSHKETELEALSARVTSSVDAIAEFLTKQLPAMPEFALSQTNPDAYIRQKAVHDAARESLNEILAKAGEVKDVADTLTDQQKQENLAEENAKLMAAFPTTATEEGRKKFFNEAGSAALDLGYSPEEIGTATDHRLFALAHYARIGMQAEKAKTKAARKVENAPPVAPQKQRQQGAGQEASRRNQEAMKRLARTGSIEDAMLVDFD